jgi:hypothetical protein
MQTSESRLGEPSPVVRAYLAMKGVQNIHLEYPFCVWEMKIPGMVGTSPNDQFKPFLRLPYTKSVLWRFPTSELAEKFTEYLRGRGRYAFSGT